MGGKQDSFLWYFCLFFQILIILNGLLQTSGLSTEAFRPTGRIVGGSDAAVNSAPYIVSIQYKSQHFCAGSIIYENWILTAAHCLVNKQQAMGSELVAGSINVRGTSTTVQRRSISNYIVHDLYTGGSSPYDIGLVYTKNAFYWTSAVKAVSLPASGVVSTGNAELYGWGSISKTNIAKYPSTLQVARNIPIITLPVCEKALGAKGNDVHNTNLCTGPLTGGISICTSDSGGPLVQINSKSQTTLIGIVSWGKLPCGQEDSPSVYVQVSSFISWINQNKKIVK